MDDDLEALQQSVQQYNRAATYINGILQLADRHVRYSFDSFCRPKFDIG